MVRCHSVTSIVRLSRRERGTALDLLAGVQLQPGIRGDASSVRQSLNARIGVEQDRHENDREPPTKVAVLAVSPMMSQTQNGASRTSVFDRRVSSAEGTTRLQKV